LEPHRQVLEIIDHAKDGEEAVEKIEALKPDLIFLDVQMPALNGFEVLERISERPWVIFCTAYDEFALKAFETNSIDYLLKPVDPARLERALDKLQRFTGHEKEQLQEHLQRLIADLKKPETKRIQVRVGDRIRFLNLKDVFFFQASDKYVEAHTFDESFLLTQTLNELESQLPAADFVRIHRSAIVNLNHLGEIVRWFGSSYRVRMLDKKKTELPVSRNCRAKLGI